MHDFDQQFKKKVKESSPSMPLEMERELDDTLAGLRPERRSPWKKVTGWTLSAAAVCVMLIMGMAYVSPGFTQAMQSLPYVGIAFERTGHTGLQHASQHGLGTQVNEPFEVRGLSGTITDVIYDGARLTIGYVQHIEGDAHEAGLQLTTLLSNLILDVDGEPLSRSGMGIGDTQLDENTNTGTVSITPAEPLPDEFMLTLRLGSERASNALHADIPVTIIDDVRTYTANGGIDTGDEQVTIQHVTRTPISTVVEVEWTFQDLEQHDQRFHNDDMILARFQLVDESGRKIKDIGSHFSGRPEEDVFRVKLQLRYEPLTETPEQLTLKPIILPLNESADLPDPAQEAVRSLPVTVDQGGIGELTITAMEFFEEETLVRAHVQGEDPYDQMRGFWFTDEDGEEYRSRFVPQKTEYKGDGMYAYTMIFPPMDEHAELTVHAYRKEPPHVLEDFVIPFTLGEEVIH